jgi:hypothetical protein
MYYATIFSEAKRLAWTHNATFVLLGFAFYAVKSGTPREPFQGGLAVWSKCLGQSHSEVQSGFRTLLKMGTLAKRLVEIDGKNRVFYSLTDKAESLVELMQGALGEDQPDL